MPLPPVEVLSALGISFVSLFGVWKLGLQPRLARFKSARTAA